MLFLLRYLSKTLVLGDLKIISRENNIVNLR